jgi:ABC-type transporter Mla subunit MlaD
MAEKAGSLLAQMLPSIRRTSDLVQEIAAASGEQKDSVDQVTGAMNHLSTATQQAASASEELSATSEELSAQATQLQNLMAFFQLRQEATPLAPTGAWTQASLARPRNGSAQPMGGSTRAWANPGARAAATAAAHGGADESAFSAF